MQTDSIGYKDGINWYAYVGNDPMDKRDPTGKIALPEIVIIGLVAATVGATACEADPHCKAGLNALTQMAMDYLNPFKPRTIFDQPVLNQSSHGNENDKAGSSEDTSADNAPSSDSSSSSSSSSSSQSSNDQKASEKYAKDLARQIGKDINKDAQREFHDMKGGGPDRTKEELKQDALDVYEQYGIQPPKWLK